MLELPPNPDYSLVNRSLLITQEQQLQFAVQIAYGLVCSPFCAFVLFLTPLSIRHLGAFLLLF